MTTRTLNWLAGFLLFGSGAWLAHARAFSGVPWEGAGARFLAPIYNNELAVYFLLLGIAGAIKAWALKKGASTTKAHVQKLLDGLVAEVMKTPNTFGAQDYRVTLFKHARFCLSASARSWRQSRRRMPWAGWLVPYARSGGEPISARTYFEAPRTSKQGQQAGHGVAGTAWIRGEANAHGLPAITSVSGQTSRRRYAKGAFIEESEVQARLIAGKSLAPSLWAERVATTKTSKWGVLVYDAIDHQPIIDTSNEAAHRLGLQALSLVLEENDA